MFYKSSLAISINAQNQKILSEVSNLKFFLFFLVDEVGGGGPNTTISGPSSAHQQNAI